MDGDVEQQTAEALQYLLERVPQNLRRPVIGIICGSGLNGLSNIVLPQAQFGIPYSSIPHFPISTGRMRRLHLHSTTTNAESLHLTVHGHAGKLLFGLLEFGRSPVVIMQGRVQLVGPGLAMYSIRCSLDTASKAIMRVIPFRRSHSRSG